MASCKKDNATSSASTAQQSWKELVTLQGPSSVLTSIALSDENTIWVLGNHKFSVKSTDGGKTWQTFIIDEDAYFDISWQKIYFKTPKIGWLTGPGRIYKTIDGGNSWFEGYDYSNHPQLSAIYDIYFLTPEKGFACGEYGFLTSTVDGGKTWKSQTVKNLNNFRLSSIIFSDENNGWVVGQNGILLGTTDGGENWKTLHSPYDLVVNTYLSATTKNIIPFSNSELLACTNNGTIKSADGGITWNSFGAPQNGIEAITKKGSAEIFATLSFSYNGTKANMAYSPDAGKTWVGGYNAGPKDAPFALIRELHNFNDKLYAITNTKQILRYDK
ncbi:MAG: WD40/YVTN/BNR-like repeat-containing protein [Bacteroidia bacterium]